MAAQRAEIGCGASIGPPRERGGKRVGPLRCGPVQGELQLGHPANGVERDSRKESANGLICFNWATPRTGWKDDDAGAVDERRIASIGPPRERGGKCCAWQWIASIYSSLQLGHPANGVESNKGAKDYRQG